MHEDTNFQTRHKDISQQTRNKDKSKDQDEWYERSHICWTTTYPGEQEGRHLEQGEDCGEWDISLYNSEEMGAEPEEQAVMQEEGEDEDHDKQSLD